MTRPVSIVIPVHGFDAERVKALIQNLEALVEEVEARAVEDQILVIDDSGRDELRAALEDRVPAVNVRARRESGGFAAAAFSGAQAADYRLMLLLAPEIELQAGAIAPLVDALQDETIAAASPRILRGGDEERIESRPSYSVEDGRFVVHYERGPMPSEEGLTVDVSFPSASAMMVRREEFLAAGGFDDLFAPVGFEDVDFGLTASRCGRRVVEVPTAVAHLSDEAPDHEGDLPESLRRAARERNRLLVYWKHLAGRREAQDHVVSLWRDALDAGLCARREDLVHLALALDELDAVSQSRG